LAWLGLTWLSLVWLELFLQKGKKEMLKAFLNTNFPNQFLKEEIVSKPYLKKQEIVLTIFKETKQSK
jgi:hypothetical protein